MRDENSINSITEEMRTTIITSKIKTVDNRKIIYGYSVELEEEFQLFSIA